MSVLSMLGISRGRATGEDAAALHRIIEELEQIEPRTAQYLAAFALQLARVAAADRVVGAGERERMEALVTEYAQLPPAHAALVVEIARHRAGFADVCDRVRLSRQLRRVASREQCLAMLACLWAVAEEEDGVGECEARTIRQIATELGLESGARGVLPGPAETTRLLRELLSEPAPRGDTAH